MNFLQNNVPQNLQKITGYLIVLLIFGLVLSSFAITLSYLAYAKNQSDQVSTRQINVSGEGKVAVKPDIATFTASVVTQAEKVRTAQEENAQRSNRIIEFTKAQGVAEKDLKTVGYNINPQYQYDNRPCIQIYPSPCTQNPPKIVSYEVRSSLELKVRDLGKVDDLLAGVVAAGANEVGTIQFSVDDEEKVKAEARKLAIEDARAKAKILSKDLRVRLGKIISFSESGGGVPIFLRAEAFGKGGGLDAPAAPQIEAGEQEIKSNVTIVYEFR